MPPNEFIILHFIFLYNDISFRYSLYVADADYLDTGPVVLVKYLSARKNNALLSAGFMFTKNELLANIGQLLLMRRAYINNVLRLFYCVLKLLNFLQLCYRN